MKENSKRFEDIKITSEMLNSKKALKFRLEKYERIRFKHILQEIENIKEIIACIKDDDELKKKYTDKLNKLQEERREFVLGFSKTNNEEEKEK